MEENFIIIYSGSSRHETISMRVIALFVLTISIYLKIYAVLFLPICLLVFTFIKKNTHINVKENIFSIHQSLFGITIKNKIHQLPNIQYILTKDVKYATQTRKGGYTTSDECYEVALVGDNRFKLVLLNSFDQETVTQLVLDLQANHGYPIRDMTHEKFIAENNNFTDVY